MTGTAVPTGITAWVAANGQVVYFFAQLAFWLLLVSAVGWAAWQFHRYVSFVVGGAQKAPAEDAAPEPEGERVREGDLGGDHGARGDDGESQGAAA